MVDGNRIVNELKEATGIENCQFQEISREEFAKMLKEMKSKGDNMTRKSCNMGLMKCPLTDDQIELYCDYFDWIKQNQCDKVSHDFKKITGKEGRRLGQFFKENADEFRPQA